MRRLASGSAVNHREAVQLQADRTPPRAVPRMATDHISDEWLHEYSQADLEEPRMSKVEEHLLICHRCRYRVIAFDRYRKIDEPSERLLNDRKALQRN